MSRKHNTQHTDRGRSHYPERLKARGLGKSPALPDLDRLRQTQLARVARGAQPWETWR